MSADHRRNTSFSSTFATADDRSELFGVHIPELQLTAESYRESFAAADLRDGEDYLELGSGHGQGLIIAAREFGANAVGVEYLDDAIERTRRDAERAGVAERIRLIRADLRSVDPTNADVIHMHLGPAFHDVLAARLEELLHQRTRVIAAGWMVHGWQPVPGTDERWDGGYVYRPGDPRMHLSWGDEVVEDGRVALIDAEVHADLEAIEPRVETDGPVPPIEVSQAVAYRGQTISVAVGRTGQPLDISIWARSRSGRLTQRGPTHRID